MYYDCLVSLIDWVTLDLVACEKRGHFIAYAPDLYRSSSTSGLCGMSHFSTTYNFKAQFKVKDYLNIKWTIVHLAMISYYSVSKLLAL